MFSKEKSNKEVVVKKYPYEQSAKAILAILKNGLYLYTNKLADREPFSGFVAVSKDEIKDYVKSDNTPDQKAIDRYVYKKKRIFLDQFIALKTLGFARQASTTSNASYVLTPYGIKMTQGLSLMDEVEKLGISYEEALKRINNNK